LTAISEFFFAAHPSVIQLQCIELIHPNFSGTYRFQRQAKAGIKVTYEDDSGPFNYGYLPMQIKTLGATSSLDQQMEITLGDVGTILPSEIALIAAANGFQTKPTLVYREYRSDEFTIIDDDPVYFGPMFGPFTLEVNALAFNKQGCVFTAKPPQFNRTRTGELYDVGRFPMLAGFV
jgi:hypothetical protein